MGLIESKQKAVYLTLEEVDKIATYNLTLQAMFDRHKNASGFLQMKDLEYVLEKKIPLKIVRRLFKIVTTEKNKMTFEEFKYLYGLFHTNKYDAKINFIADMIFFLKQVIVLPKYKKRVELFFISAKDIYRLLSSPEFIILISDKNRKIAKTEFIRVSNSTYRHQLEDFSFTKAKDYRLSENLHHCACLNVKPPKNTFECYKTSSKQYDQMEYEFKKIEKSNNGTFTISLFEEMLNELGINKRLITLISSYLKKKTQKSFLNFDLFKVTIFRLCQGNEEMWTQVFEIFAYPNDYIKKSDLFILFKSVKAGMNSKAINSAFEEYQISQEQIDRHKFKDIIRLINSELSESFERLKYLPYLYFHVRLNDQTLEKNCIEILWKGKTDIRQYIEEASITEKEFFIIDAEFWYNWLDDTKDPSKGKNNMNNKKKETAGLRICTAKISDASGKLTEGLVYLKDFLILPKKMYELFTLWHGLPEGPEMKRKKIYTNETAKCRPKTGLSPIVGMEGKFKYEIEIYPIFLAFFLFEDILNQSGSVSNIKEQLRISYSNTHSEDNFNLKYFPFSRQTKYKELIQPLESTGNFIFDPSNSRLWVYFQHKFFVASFEKTLEDDDIIDCAIIVVEKRKNKKWPSEQIENENTGGVKNVLSSNAFVGLVNIGNTCYMNSVMQTFLNNYDLKNILLKENFELLINYRNKFGIRGSLINEFLNLLNEKWIKDRKTIVPKKWKEVIGEANEAFKGFDQQDAHDYFNFMLDNLHEEVDLKTEKEYIPNPSGADGSDEEVAGHYWANNIRRNASFFHALFLGQLKSTLICQKCNTAKASYETFSSLSLPIPQNSKIMLDIVLFRLPFTYKIYYEPIQKSLSSDLMRDGGIIDIRSQLKLIRKQSMGYNMDINNLDESELSIYDKSVSGNILPSISSRNITKNKFLSRGDPLTTVYYDEINSQCAINKQREQSYQSSLTTNIPIRLRIEINRKEKVEKIISMVKRLYDLELEQENQYTTLLILNNNQYVDTSMKIDDCFSSGQRLNMYELINSKGIKEMFHYSEEESRKVQPLSAELIQAFLNGKSVDIFSSDNFEFLVNIIHSYEKACSIYFINTYRMRRLETLFNCMIMTKHNPIRASHLYDMIWEKFEYFLSNPSKIEKNLWWKKISPSTDKPSQDQTLILNMHHPDKSADTNPLLGHDTHPTVKMCSPFVIKIVNKFTLSCGKCPWFSFCPGCVVDPVLNEFIEISPNHSIVVEWCREIAKKEIIDENLRLIINHHTIGSIEEKTRDYEKKISLEDCLNLYTEMEDLGEDKLHCNKCAMDTSWRKKYEIERLPQYLVIALKRFNYTRVYKKKIDSLITFPINDMDVTDYMCYKGKKFSSYDLFAVVNHTGSMSSGHYTSIVRHESKWIKYDDSHAYEIDDMSLLTPMAYLLIYKVKEDISGLASDYITLLSTAYQIDFLSVVLDRGLRTKKPLSELSQDGRRTSVSSKTNIDVNNRRASFESTPPMRLNSQKSRGLNSTMIGYIIGEPVKTVYGRGYILQSYMLNQQPFVKVKLTQGYAHIRANANEIQRETVFIYSTPSDFAKAASEDKNKKASERPEIVEITKVQPRKCSKCSIY